MMMSYRWGWEGISIKTLKSADVACTLYHRKNLSEHMITQSPLPTLRIGYRQVASAGLKEGSKGR